MRGEWLRPGLRRPADSVRCLMRVETLEDRVLAAANFMSLPAVPAIDATTAAFLRQVLAYGASLGNRPNVFMKAGDSITIDPLFLRPFGNAAGAATLRSADPNGVTFRTAQAFQTPVPGGNSFSRTSLSALGGWNTSQVFNAVGVEASAIRPAFAVLMVGTNDLGPTPADVYKAQLTAVVQKLLVRGVIPIISTVPDALIQGQEGVNRTLRFNQIIADVAAENRVPMMNYWLPMQSLPNRGVSTDGVHPSTAGYALRSVLAVQALAVVRQAVGL